ncbi:hypothetical protein YC2023_037865 [Brassica napus]
MLISLSVFRDSSEYICGYLMFLTKPLFVGKSFAIKFRIFTFLPITNRSENFYQSESVKLSSRRMRPINPSSVKHPKTSFLTISTTYTNVFCIYFPRILILRIKILTETATSLHTYGSLMFRSHTVKLFPAINPRYKYATRLPPPIHQILQL